MGTEGQTIVEDDAKIFGLPGPRGRFSKDLDLGDLPQGSQVSTFRRRR